MSYFCQTLCHSILKNNKCSFQYQAHHFILHHKHPKGLKKIHRSKFPCNIFLMNQLPVCLFFPLGYWLQLWQEFCKSVEIFILFIPFCVCWMLLPYLPAFPHSTSLSQLLVSPFKKFWPGPRFCSALLVFIWFEEHFKNLGKKHSVLLNG